MTKVHGFAAAALLAGFAQPAMAQGPLGGDAAACMGHEGPAILANVSGLKDRKGIVKLELYPATAADFTKDDRDLIAQGKTFRRVAVSTPQSGPIALCIRVPHPGRYALLFTHNRDGKNKFDIWSTGVGIPSNAKIGRARPTVTDATIEVGSGVAVVAMRAQYMRGLSGFGPVGN